ncbi:DUF945 family protein [Psychromonas sp. GE-S-Ul-11]|uniref:DUF945 family protein n=1 Tax=Psychromonas sp. GE-S-Ul-11 TaxID=3241170 RepID=UPI00390C8B21
MRKLFIISILIVGCLLLGSTYFVGVQIEKTLKEQIAQLDSPDVDVQLLDYHKSFFHTHADFKVLVSLPERAPLEIIMASDITHYPYKARSVNTMQLSDQALQNKLNTFFQTEDWFSSTEEINVFGKVQGKLSLPKGLYETSQETLNTGPLTLTYDYDLKNQQSDMKLNWGGFNGVVESDHFAAKDISIVASFIKLEAANLVDYQYKADIGEFDFQRADKQLTLQQASLSGASTTADDRLTLNSQNTWKVKSLHNGPQTFTDTELSLALNKLNIAALNELKMNIDDPEVMHKALSYLVSLGVNVDLDKLHSKTPWGQVSANLKMDVQPNVALQTVTNNPLMLIDYSNGTLNLSLPQSLLGESVFTGLLQMALNNGILAQDADKLSLQATLDRGELIVNDRVIPM